MKTHKVFEGKLVSWVNNTFQILDAREDQRNSFTISVAFEIISLKLWSTTLVAGSDNGECRAWDIVSLRELYAFKAFGWHAVHCLEVIGKKVIAASWQTGECKVCELDPPSYRCLTLKGHNGGITHIKVVDGDLITSSLDKTCKVWELSSGACRYSILNTPEVRAVDIFEGNLIVGSEDGFFITELASGKRLFTHSDPSPVKLNCIHHLGGKIFVSTSDGNYQVLDFSRSLTDDERLNELLKGFNKSFEVVAEFFSRMPERLKKKISEAFEKNIQSSPDYKPECGESAFLDGFKFDYGNQLRKKTIASLRRSLWIEEMKLKTLKICDSVKNFFSQSVTEKLKW